MTNDLYLGVDVDHCLSKGHRFRLVWSDKTPLKVSLSCLTCSDASHKNAFAAYGVDTQSWGLWFGKSATFLKESQ